MPCLQTLPDYCAEGDEAPFNKDNNTFVTDVMYGGLQAAARSAGPLCDAAKLAMKADDFIKVRLRPESGR